MSPSSLLSTLESTGQYLFHGAGHEIEEFEPRQAHNYRGGTQIPDGEPAIYASPLATYAWFMAVVNEVNCPKGHWSGAGTRTGKLRFRATQATLDQLTPESKGYVYVFDKEGFVKRSDEEYYSLEKRTPIKRIEVTFKDFDAPIDVMSEERREYLGQLKDGSQVYIDLDTSHAITHLAHHPKLRGVIQRLLPTLEGGPEWIRIEQDMGEEVGTTDLVETTDADEIVYALRPRRQVYSRFVKNKESIPTSWITVAIHKVKEKEYELYTAFVGRNTPSFPGGDYLPEQSKEFWSTHALVWGSQEVIPGSETKECPW